MNRITTHFFLVASLSLGIGNAFANSTFAQSKLTTEALDEFLSALSSSPGTDRIRCIGNCAAQKSAADDAADQAWWDERNACYEAFQDALRSFCRQSSHESDEEWEAYCRNSYPTEYDDLKRSKEACQSEAYEQKQRLKEEAKNAYAACKAECERRFPSPHLSTKQSVELYETLLKIGLSVEVAQDISGASLQKECTLEVLNEDLKLFPEAL